MAKMKIDLANPDNLSIRPVAWADVRRLVANSNPELARIIDDIDPGNDLPLIEACYPFGVDIHKLGTTYFPTNNGYLSTLDEPDVDNSIRKLLDYSTCPLGLIIDKSTEVYVEASEGRSIPFKLFEAGTTFGVWEIMDFAKIQMRRPWFWNISSGARTVFLLPSVGERNSFKRLVLKHKLKNHVPKNIFDQRRVFAQISRNSNIDWKTKIIYFSKPWTESNSRLFELQKYWQNEAWQQILYWANNVNIFNSWEDFLRELDKRKVKPKDYILNTLKHLFSIGCGTIPGFQAVKNENTLPMHLIQDAYINDYQLKYYYPLMLQPTMFSTNNRERFIYYSLQYPTLPEKPPNFSSFPSVLTILRELKSTVDIFLDLAEKWPTIGQSKVLDFLDFVKFDYFHSEKDKYNQVDTTDLLFKEDPNLGIDESQYGPRLQPETAHFFRGCIRIGFHEKGLR